jgi:hypothetical protein
MKKVAIFYIISLILIITALIVMVAGMFYNSKEMVEIGILSALVIYNIGLIPRLLCENK